MQVQWDLPFGTQTWVENPHTQWKFQWGKSMNIIYKLGIFQYTM
jgi:hypothetical protein